MLSNGEIEHPALFAAGQASIWRKRIVIIGDADGIGRLVAAELVAQGAVVFIAVCSPAEMTAAFATISKTEAEWHGMVVDWDQPDAARKFIHQAALRLGQIDVLIDIMAVDPCSQPAEEACVAETLRQMRRRRGKIVQLSWGEEPLSPALRRKAGEIGVQILSIAPVPDPFDESVPDGRATARCITHVLAHSFTGGGIAANPSTLVPVI